MFYLINHNCYLPSIRLKNAQVTEHTHLLFVQNHNCTRIHTHLYTKCALKKSSLNSNILSSSLLSPFMCLRERKRAKLAKEHYEGWRDYSKAARDSVFQWFSQQCNSLSNASTLLTMTILVSGGDGKKEKSSLFYTRLKKINVSLLSGFLGESLLKVLKERCRVDPRTVGCRQVGWEIWWDRVENLQLRSASVYCFVN